MNTLKMGRTETRISFFKISNFGSRILSLMVLLLNVQICVEIHLKFVKMFRKIKSTCIRQTFSL